MCKLHICKPFKNIQHTIAYTVQFSGMKCKDAKAVFKGMSFFDETIQHRY